MRCVYVHQQLLEDISPSLKTEVTTALERSISSVLTIIKARFVDA